FVDRCGGGLGEAQVDDLDLVAAALVETDRRAHQRGNAVQLFLLARLIGGFAIGAAVVVAVDQHGDRDAVDAPAFGHFGLGRAGDLVIDDFLGLAGLLARILIAFRAPLAAGKLVADADLAFLPVAAGRRFLPRLARTHDAAFGIES